MTSRFLTHFLALTMGSYAVLLGLQAAFGARVVHPLAPAVLGALLALTLLAYWFTAWAVRRSPDNFLAAYFGGVGLRLLLGIGMVLLYFFRGHSAGNHDLLTFLSAFFLAYFLCAGFEIWAIFSNLRPFSAKPLSKND